MILTEPRMSLNRVGPLQLQEATDDLGNSLLPAAAGYVMPMAVGGAIGFNATGPYFATAIAVLDRPQNAGRLIKTLRGTVEIAVAARRSDTLVIPWQGAAGKTFQNDALHVVVDSITSDAARKQDVIVLSIEEIDQLFPGQSDNGPREPGVGGMGGFSTPQRFGAGNDPQSPIQIINTRGQDVFLQAVCDRDAGRLTLNVPQQTQPIGEIKEIRVSSIVRAKTKVPFAFRDLPMP